MTQRSSLSHTHTPISPISYLSLPPLYHNSPHLYNLYLTNPTSLSPYLSSCISPILHLSLSYPLSHITIPSSLHQSHVSQHFLHLSLLCLLSRFSIISLNIPLLLSYYTAIFYLLSKLSPLSNFSHKIIYPSDNNLLIHY